MYYKHYSRDVEGRCREEIRGWKPNLVYLDHLDSFVYFNECKHLPVVLDAHNVYSQIASRASLEAGNPLTRAYLWREASLLGRFEREAARAVRRVLCVSPEDAVYFQQHGASTVLAPNGVETSRYEAFPLNRSSLPPTILYIGAMSWLPNVSAAKYLAETIFPLIRRRVEGVRLQIVGKNPPTELRALHRPPEIEILGEVPDILPYLAQATVQVVPLESGGGTRLKILESFAAGLPVVSTRVGCEGIAAVHDEHLLVAERDAMPEQVLRLLQNPQRALEIAGQARRFVKERYDWASSTQPMLQSIRELLT
jgi:glycosyltransferase involved in cell wall biosynthesis